MKNIKEDYVSFETAKLLKEKGFDGKCKMKYNQEGTMLHHVPGPTDLMFTTDKKEIERHSIKNHIEYFLCPTLQMAMKWLREVHSCYINTYWEFKNYNENGNPVFKDIIWCYNISIPKYNSARKGDGDYFDIDSEKEDYTTYEEVCEVAIKYCLENLI